MADSSGGSPACGPRTAAAVPMIALARCRLDRAPRHIRMCCGGTRSPRFPDDLLDVCRERAVRMRNPWLRKSAVGFEDGRRKPRRIEGCNCLKSRYADVRYHRIVTADDFGCRRLGDRLPATERRTDFVSSSSRGRWPVGSERQRPAGVLRALRRPAPGAVCIVRVRGRLFRETFGRLPERACVFGHFVVGSSLAVSRAAVRTADGIRWALQWAGPSSGSGLHRPGPHSLAPGRFRRLPVGCRKRKRYPTGIGYLFRFRSGAFIAAPFS